MAKKYLNSESQQELFVLAAIHNTAIKHGEDKKNEQKKEWGYLEKWAKKGMIKLLQDIDDTEATTVLKRADNFEFAVLTKDKYKKAVEEELKRGEVVALNKEQLETLAMAAVSSCCICESHGQEIEDCKTRKILLQCELTPFKTFKECPFRVN